MCRLRLIHVFVGQQIKKSFKCKYREATITKIKKGKIFLYDFIIDSYFKIHFKVRIFMKFAEGNHSKPRSNSY